jgi:hypothetical protein
MVAPVTGPFTKYIELKGPPNIGGFAPVWYSREQSGFRQKRPYNVVLGHTVDVMQVLSSSDNSNHTVSIGDCPSIDSGSITIARNKAYEKLKDNVGTQSLWAVNVAERQQAYSMIAARANTLVKFTRALKKGNLKKAAATLSVAVPEKLRGRYLKKGAKDLGNLWLEYHFGWEPLLKDIHDGIETIRKPIRPPKRKAVGRGSDRRTLVDRTGGSFWTSSTVVTETKVSESMDIEVGNPSLHLAEQLGLVNPLAVAWELVPFSFVVDWFANVGSFLSSFTDFAGLDTYNHRTSTLQVRTETTSSYTGFIYSTRRLHFQRQTSISGTVLAIAPWKSVSPVRGLTAISLLLQHLKT